MRCCETQRKIAPESPPEDLALRAALETPRLRRAASSTPLARLERTIALGWPLIMFECITLDDKATLQYRNSTSMRGLKLFRFESARCEKCSSKIL